MTFITNVITNPSDNQVDAFSRLRVSNPLTLVDIKHIQNINDEAETQSITGSGTITLNANHPSVDLTLTGTGSLIRRSRNRGVYQPSKSLLILITGVLNNGGLNTTNTLSRIGFYDADDGLYFEHVGDGASGVIYVVKRSCNTGSVVNTAIAQSSWNIDKMDGTGQSGITLDTSKSAIFIIDLEWLGVGRVRFGFGIGGKYIYVHEILHSNTVEKPYMNLASQPVSYELVSTLGGTGSLRMICGSVVSEGGFDPSGVLRSVNNGSVVKTVNTVENSMMAIRIKSTTPKVQLRIINIQAVSDESRRIILNVYLFKDTADTAILTGQSWVPVNNSSVDYDMSATTLNITNGNKIGMGYISRSGITTLPQFDISSINTTLSTNLQNQSDILVLAAQTSAASDNLLYGITWIEYL